MKSGRLRLLSPKILPSKALQHFRAGPASFSTDTYQHKDSLHVLISDIDNARLLSFNLERPELSAVIPVPMVEDDKYPVFTYKHLDPDTIVILRDVTNSRRNYDSIYTCKYCPPLTLCGTRILCRHNVSPFGHW